jgi:hypothetical protein
MAIANATRCGRITCQAIFILISVGPTPNSLVLLSPGVQNRVVSAVAAMAALALSTIAL